MQLRKYLGKIRNFRAATGKYLGNKKPTTFAGQSFLIQKKLLFEVKILFKDHSFFGIKIEKSEIDSK